MKRLALIFNVTNGHNVDGSFQDPLNTDLDASRLIEFLMSKAGGAWNENEIQLFQNKPAKTIIRILAMAKTLFVDYCMVYFSGHGRIYVDRFGRQTDYFQAFDGNEVNTHLAQVATRNLIISDTCRGFDSEAPLSPKALIGDLFEGRNEVSRVQVRAQFERAVLICESGSVFIHSCSPNEGSADTPSGGLFTQILFETADIYGDEIYFPEFGNISKVFALARKSTISESQKMQNPSIDGCRRMKWFPFSMGYKLKLL